MNCWIRDRRKWEVHLLRQNMRLRHEGSYCHDNSNIISIFSLRMLDYSRYMVRLFHIQSTSLPEGNCRFMHSPWCLPVVVVMDVCVCVCQSFQILNQLTYFHKTMHECDDTWGYLHIILFNFVHNNMAKYMILWGGRET